MPDDLAELRARVSAHGSPDNVSKQLALEFLRFADAPLPAFEGTDGGLYLRGADGVAQKDACGNCSFFKPLSDRAKGRLQLKCQRGACTAGPISYTTSSALTDPKRSPSRTPSTPVLVWRRALLG